MGERHRWISLLMVSKLWRRVLPVGIATVLLWALYQLGICQSIDNLAYDAFFRLRGALPWNAPIVLVEVDEQSLPVLGEAPWSRQSYAALIEKLTPNQPAAIVLNILFRAIDPADAQLAEAMKQGRVVLAQSWNAQNQPVLTSPVLQKAAQAIGYVANAEAEDGGIRYLQAEVQGVPALSLAATQVYLAAKPQLAASVQWPKPDQGLWVNWLSPEQARDAPQRYSFSDVLQDRVAAEVFRDKIVLVGLAIDEFNTLQTPFNTVPPISDLYLQATLIANLLHNALLQRLPELHLMLLLAGIVVLSTWVGCRFLYRMALWAGLCLGWGLLSYGLFLYHYWVPVAVPMLWFGLCGAGVALDELLQTHWLLRQSEERYALAVRGANEGLWDWDLRSDRIYFSPRWKEMLGYAEHELSNRPHEWFSRVHPLDLAPLKLSITHHLRSLDSHFEYEYRLFHRDGTYHWMLCRGLAVRNVKGTADRLVGAQSDITQRKQTEEELRQSAFYDRLTGLPNRANCALQIEQALLNAQRFPITSFAVLCLDLDQFKVVNNSLGNSIGDRILIAVAQRLKAFLPPEDSVARLGGDEFAIVLHQVQDARDATRFAERIQQVLSLPFNIDGHEVFITASIGIALSTAHYTQPEHILRDADTAMHRAKGLGRARYQVFDRTMRMHLLIKLQMENDLRRAIAQGERYADTTLFLDFPKPDRDVPDKSAGPVSGFTRLPQEQELRLYYQPVVCLTTGLITGFEALVRWQHPEQGLLSPMRFIPMAEETGLIVPLGWWVLRTACHQMRYWQTVFPEQSFLTVSVNLSSHQFSRAGLIEQIRQILREAQLEAAHLKLEMTESTVMENAASVVDMLHQLRSQGIQLAIDDFGTGYSSLSYLPRFPIDSLKIDRSFVSQLGECDDSLEVVRTILALAHNLGMDVTAEGVETAGQVHQLLEMNCEYGQGYLFSRPIDAAGATQLLAQQKA